MVREGNKPRWAEFVFVIGLFLLAGLAPSLSPEALAQDVVAVQHQHIPANGIGGILTVSESGSGGAVAKGALVTFTAKPVGTFYVFRWSHPACTETGDEDNPGVEKTCVIAANMELLITVTFAEAINPWKTCPSGRTSADNVLCLARCDGSNATYFPRAPDGQKVITYDCPGSAPAKHCDIIMECLFDGGYEESCLEIFFNAAPLSECHTKGGRECRNEAHRKLGAVCIPPVGITGVKPLPLPPEPPSDVAGNGLFALVHPEQFVVLEWRAPDNFNRAIVSGYEILRETNGSGNFQSVDFASGHYRNNHVDRNPPRGATVRYKVRVRSDPGPGPVSGASNPVVIPMWDSVDARDCAVENRFPVVDLQQCGSCFLEHEEVGGFPVGSDGVCVPREGGFGELSQEGLCGAFGGVVKDEGDGKICSGIDQAGTFCILDSKDAFPCRGLFKTVRTCNLVHNRPALNPFACAAKCPSANDIVVGDECRRNMITPP